MKPKQQNREKYIGNLIMCRMTKMRQHGEENTRLCTTEPVSLSLRHPITKSMSPGHPVSSHHLHFTLNRLFQSPGPGCRAGPGWRGPVLS